MEKSLSFESVMQLTALVKDEEIVADFSLDDLPTMENECGIEVLDHSCDLTVSGECFHIYPKPCSECILYQKNLLNYPEEKDGGINV